MPLPTNAWLPQVCHDIISGVTTGPAHPTMQKGRGGPMAVQHYNVFSLKFNAAIFVQMCAAMRKLLGVARGDMTFLTL